MRCKKNKIDITKGQGQRGNDVKRPGVEHEVCGPVIKSYQLYNRQRSRQVQVVLLGYLTLFIKQAKSCYVDQTGTNRVRNFPQLFNEEA